MNRFKKLIDDLRERADKDGALVHPQKDSLVEEVHGEDVPRFRLPYSSEPTPIDDPWNDQ